ncbi:protein HLJ1 [Diospyros lotus]|uniref:protein HLJ1 n=1 Tax=Diospyros lotus TaxID=55363 RepID=UPI00225B9E8A|nr:protein HLJ1 [Diospyros lotus]
MGEEESDLKSRLVTEICSIPTLAKGCSHFHGGGDRETTTPFIDWYLVLRVDEDAGLDVIRKQYHKLALQLHPDKNKHPMAETAFKLVSEAYGCLSDGGRRIEFNVERRNSRCIDCKGIRRRPAAMIGGTMPMGRSTSRKMIRAGFRDLRARFAEEVRVIENCLASGRGSSVFSPPAKEQPVFNPSDYQFYGYPHRRTGGKA